MYGEFTTPRLIVEDYVSGIPINHYDELIKAGYDLEDIGRKLMLSFIKQVFKDGFFHGDPHPGNIFISDDKIYFIDFGIMGKLDNGMRVALNDILYSFTAQDIEGMMKGILSITSFDTSMNKSTLAQDVERMLAKYSSLDIGVLSITDLIEDLLNVFVKNGLKASPQITILEKAAQEENPLILILDGLNDPHNFGSILRTADATNVTGVIIPKHRAVGVTPVVAKTSTGAVEHVPIARVTNLSQTLDKLKEQGFWVFGTDMNGTPSHKWNTAGKLALIIGNEGKGISPNIKKQVDEMITIPMNGHVQSLNASVAAAVLMYEVFRHKID